MGTINNLTNLTFTAPSDTSLPAPTSPSVSPDAVQPPSAVEDQVQLATIPFPAQAEQALQSDNPPDFQAVLGDAIRNLRAAARQSADPLEAAYLSGLADRFQRLQESGDSSAPVSSTQAASA